MSVQPLPASLPPHVRLNIVPPRAAALDASAFPHVLDHILSFASFHSLLSFRATCRALRGRVDRVLWDHVVLAPHAEDADGLPAFLSRRAPCARATVASVSYNRGRLRHPVDYARWHRGLADSAPDRARRFSIASAAHPQPQATPAPAAQLAERTQVAHNLAAHTRVLDISGGLGDATLSAAWFASALKSQSHTLSAVRLLSDAQGALPAIPPVPAHTLVIWPSSRPWRSAWDAPADHAIPPGFRKVVQHVALTCDVRPLPLFRLDHAFGATGELGTERAQLFPPAVCYAPRAQLPRTTQVVLTFSHWLAGREGERPSLQTAYDGKAAWAGLVAHVVTALTHGASCTVVDLHQVAPEWFDGPAPALVDVPAIALEERLAADVRAALQHRSRGGGGPLPPDAADTNAPIPPVVTEADTDAALARLAFLSREKYEATLASSQRDIEWAISSAPAPSAAGAPKRGLLAGCAVM